MRPIYRSLVVGLGRWGRQVVEQTWLGLRARSQDRQSDVPYVAALVIDMDVDSSPDTPVELLPTDSYLVLSSKGMQAYLQSLANDNADILKNIPENADPSKFETGSDVDIKNKRLGSAMVIKRRQKQLENVFDLHLTRLVNDHEWIWAKENEYQPALDNAVTVYLVAALDEVVGSGFLPTVLETLPKLEFFNDPSRRLNLVGVFTAFGSLNNAFASANSYATIVELNGTLDQWLHDAKNARQLAASQVCYLIESVNEKGEPIQAVEGEKLVVQFLTNSITRPIPSGLVGNGFSPQNDGYGKNIQRLTPSYNSFTQIEYALPTEQIKAYLSDFIGKDIVSPSGLLQGTINQKSIQALSAQFQGAEWRLTPDVLLGDASNKIFDETIFLSRNDQQRILFSIPSFHEVIKASRLHQSLDVVQNRQKERQNFFQAYQETLSLHVHDRTIPFFSSKLKGFINKVITSNFDGLDLSIAVAQNLRDSLSLWNKQSSGSVDKEEQVKRLQKADVVGKQYKNIITETTRPSILISQFVWTIFVNLFLWIIVFGAFVPNIIEGSGWVNLASKLSRSAVVFTTPLAWFIPFLILLFSFKYLFESIFIDRINKNNSGYTVPDIWNLIFSAIWPALVAGIGMYFLYRQVAAGASLYLNLLPQDFLQTLVIGTGLTGIASSILYGWFHYRKINAIKDLLVVWVTALEESASYDYYLLRYHTAEAIYLEQINQCDNEKKRIAAYKNALLQLHEFLSKQQNEQLMQMQKSDYRFRKLAVASHERLQAIFERDLASKPDIQSASFVSALGEGEYLRWLDQTLEEKAGMLAQFALAKISGIFDGKNLITFLAPDAKGDDVELRKLLLPQLSFVRDYGPQWSLYSQKGVLQVFAGVGDEDDVALRDALKGIGAVAFQAQPTVYETGDPYSLILTISRRDRELNELEELQNYKREYLKFEPWQVHTRRLDLLDPLPKVTKLEKTQKEQNVLSQPVPKVEITISTPAQARQKLGVGENATDEEIKTRVDVLLKAVDGARDGLLDRYNRYQHFSQIERGEIQPPNWYNVLELEINRNVSVREIEAAYTRKKKQLESCLDLLASREQTKQGDLK